MTTIYKVVFSVKASFLLLKYGLSLAVIFQKTILAVANSSREDLL